MQWFAGCRRFIETLELSGKYPLSFSTLGVSICDNGLGGIWPGEMMMRTLMMSLLVILHLLGCVSYSLGHPLLHIYLSPLGKQSLTARDMIEHARSITTSVLFFQSNPHQKYTDNPSTRSFISPTSAPLPSHPAFNAGPSSSLSPRHHGRRRHRHHHLKPPAVDGTPSDPACDQTCVDPLTATPFGSTCGCVFPMKVRLLLTVAPLDVFPVINELEIEVATATYLEQSQVKIMGATADSQNQGRTVVDINLVPLGEKFDNTTAALTYERFLHKKVVLNVTLFGNYEVVYISYPGIPTSPPQGADTASGPRGSAGDLPISANFVNKSPGLNVRTIAIIGLSAFVIILVFIGAVSFLIKRRKFGRPSSVGPTLASSLNKRSRVGSLFSSNISSSPAMSLMSSMPTCVLSVRTFALSELEKATENFSSKRILGEGGFGCVYCGTMEDGTEAAVKLLTRDKQNQDREFIAEVEMLSRLHHRNLVKLIGICIEGWTRCLVYEIVYNGSVESHLHGDDKIKGPLTWDARMKIALGAARGLAYLHEDSNPRVIHRDFKASNVLLENDFTPKVADFGLAREATEGSEHISTRVMGTFGYVAPEYAMTGHLLVKSDVYSYGVVLLELLSGRKPVDMSQPSGQENLVTWARPLLTSREGLEQLVDPTLAAGTYDFDDMAKVAAIASMCVQPEVTHRPFMGEVVQALKLIYNDTDETGGDCASQKESSTDFAPYGQTSSFMTMDYSSGPLEDTDNNRPFPFSTTRFVRDENRSGPLRIIRSKPNYRLRGSMSEHGGLLPRHIWGDSYWV